MIDDQLTFSDHIAKTARSCRFALFNIKKIRPFLSEHASQLRVQALVLSRLDYCNALLAGLPASSIKPLQLIQNAAGFALATNSCSHKIQGIDVCLQNHHWLCTPYVPLEACVLQVNFTLLFIPKRHKITFTDFYINCSLLVE